MPLLLALIGMSLLALALARHWRQWFGDPLRTPAAGVLLGCAALPCFATGLALHLEAEATGAAILAWGFEIMATGVIVALLCGLRARAITRAERAAREITSDSSAIRSPSPAGSGSRSRSGRSRQND